MAGPDALRSGVTESRRDAGLRSARTFAADAVRGGGGTHMTPARPSIPPVSGIHRSYFPSAVYPITASEGKASWLRESHRAHANGKGLNK